MTGPVRHRLKSNVGGYLFAKFLKGFVKAIDHFNGVGVLRFLDGEQQGALAVVHRHVFNFLSAVFDSCHLRQANRCAAFAGHNDVAKIFRAFNARLNLNDTLLGGRAQRAYRLVLIFIPHCRGNLLCADTQSLHGIWAQVNVDLSAATANHIDSANAANIFKAFFQKLLRVIGQFDQACLCNAVIDFRNHRQ